MAIKKMSIEPDDGYEYEKDNSHHPWEYWEAERQKRVDREWPGLFDVLPAGFFHGPGLPKRVEVKDERS